MLDDTSPAARREYFARIARLTPAQRVAIAMELSTLSDQLVRAGVKRRNPEATEEEQAYQVLRIKYGRDLADRVYGRRSSAAP